MRNNTLKSLGINLNDLEEFSNTLVFNDQYCEERDINLLGKRATSDSESVAEVYQYEVEKEFEPEINIPPLSTNTNLTAIANFDDVKLEEGVEQTKTRVPPKPKDDLHQYSLEERNLIRMCQRFEKKADIHHIFQKWMTDQKRHKLYNELGKLVRGQESDYQDCMPHLYTIEKEITMFCNGKRDQRKITIYFDRFTSLNANNQIKEDAELDKFLDEYRAYLHDKYD